ncbi:MAG: hypothetical protein EB084_04950 [Proteobacteria bacterium]|nr:hypothetical protein [Pseudomonadota bacterium]
MSRLRLSLLALVLIVALLPVRAALADDASTIVPGVSVGPLHLGMTEEQVAGILGKPQLRGPAAESGDPSVPVQEGKTSLTVLQYFKQKLTILVRSGKVSSIMVLSSTYRTPNGLSVDSKISEVQTAYGTGVVKEGKYGPDVNYPKEGIRFLCLGEQVFGIEVRMPSGK